MIDNFIITFYSIIKLIDDKKANLNNRTLNLEHVKKYDNFIISFFLKLLGLARNYEIAGKNYCLNVQSLQESITKIKDIISPILSTNKNNTSSALPEQKIDINPVLSQAEQEEVERIFNKPVLTPEESEYLLKLVNENKLEMSQLTPHLSKLKINVDSRIDI